MKKILLITVLLVVVALVAVLTVALLVDCGQQADELKASDDDSIYYSQHKPAGVHLPNKVNTFLTSLTKSFEAHDLDAVMAHFSEDFLHQGMMKQDFREHIARSYYVKHLRTMRISLLKFEPHDGVADIAGFIETDLGILLQSSEVLPVLEGSQLRLEQGQWKLFGNRQTSRRGAFQDFLVITTTLAPRDPALYRALLPDSFDMPETPTVTVSMTEHQRVVLPLSPYRMGRIQLLGRYRDDEGWYDLALPETAWAPVKFGQTVGYPKYVVDSIEFEQTRNSWRGEASDKGQLILSMEFTPDPSVENWLERLTRPSCLNLVRLMLPGYSPKPVFLLTPAAQRQDTSDKTLLVKATIASFETPSLVETFGRVKMVVNPDAPWAGLFPAEAEVKGSLMKFSGDWNIRHQILNDELKNP